MTDLIQMNNIPPDGQILYKLGSLEALVKSSMDRINDQITSLRREMGDNHLGLATEQAKLGTRLENVEKWKTVVTAKIGISIFAVSTLLVFLAPTLRHILGLSNG